MAIKEEDNNQGGDNGTDGGNGQLHDTWIKDKVYNGGERVIYGGKEYIAKWWTCGDTPGEKDVWQLVQ